MLSGTSISSEMKKEMLESRSDSVTVIVILEAFQSLIAVTWTRVEFTHQISHICAGADIKIPPIN